MRSLGLLPERVVIELTEDYPTLDFQVVHESLMLYRSMGFRVAIDDLGEGFASLRLWSELKPEFVKADKHFVTGIAGDPVKLQFLRAIQHIAESSGSLVIAEGIENAADFKVVKDIGVACGQGWFIGRPAEFPGCEHFRGGRARASRHAHGGRALPRGCARAPSPPRMTSCARSMRRPRNRRSERFSKGSPLRRRLPPFRVPGAAGVEGVVSRSCVDLVAACDRQEELRSRPCIEFAPIARRSTVEADPELAALTAILVEARIAPAGRRVRGSFQARAPPRHGHERRRDALAAELARARRALPNQPLTLPPGQVPINEHPDRLLARKVPFTAWFAELGQMRGLNDSQGFAQGDAPIHSAARLWNRRARPESTLPATLPAAASCC